MDRRREREEGGGSICGDPEGRTDKAEEDLLAAGASRTGLTGSDSRLGCFDPPPAGTARFTGKAPVRVSESRMPGHAQT